MIWLLLAGGVLAFLVFLGRRSRNQLWRPAGAVLATGALTIGATLLALKIFIPAIALIGLSALLALFARYRPTVGMPPEPVGIPLDLSDSDARALLGVGPGASREEIEAAYRRLMTVNHPDKGGTKGLAAQLNAARDKLLRG